MIACEDGEIAIEAIKTGDIVNTLSDGPQVVRWVGSAEHTTPVVQIMAGALGGTTPAKNLLVAPAQRMVLSGWQAEVLFGETRVLVVAEALVNQKNISLIKQPHRSECFHILFDKHETIAANGTASESFYPSNFALSSLPAEARSALATQAPELRTLDPSHPFDLVHPAISAAEAALLR
ncbi:MAG: hypothetical protein GQ535_07330 [Rhodobacteraceae bacterium]|nr:hypothetical protein [Paracoccaceae bacterium]